MVTSKHLSVLAMYKDVFEVFELMVIAPGLGNNKLCQQRNPVVIAKEEVRQLDLFPCSQCCHVRSAVLYSPCLLYPMCSCWNVQTVQASS